MEPAAMTGTCLADIVQVAPRVPGVYLMRDGVGEIIYVGKAKDLRARLRNYAGGTDSRGMIPFLLSRVRQVEWIITATEKEALILENNLIKEHRPRYNVVFRDDKAYFHIRMDTAVPFPRWQLVGVRKKTGRGISDPTPPAAPPKRPCAFCKPSFPSEHAGMWNSETAGVPAWNIRSDAARPPASIWSLRKPTGGPSARDWPFWRETPRRC